MSITNVGGVSPAAGTPAGPPETVTRADLIALKQQLSKAGVLAPGLDSLISGLSTQSPPMTFIQFQRYAALNGLNVSSLSSAPGVARAAASSTGAMRVLKASAAGAGHAARPAPAAPAAMPAAPPPSAPSGGVAAGGGSHLNVLA